MKYKTVLTAATCATLLLTSCTLTPPLKKNLNNDADTSREKVTEILNAQRGDKTTGKRFVVQDEADATIGIKKLSAQEQEIKEKAWLTDVRITLDPAKDAAISAPAIIRMFREKGVNIVSTLSLDQYSYNGFGVTNVDAETALMVFMGAIGLDFEIDNARHLVTVQPMKPKTWVFNIGNRRTSFSGGADSSSPLSAATSGIGSGLNATTSAGPTSAGAPVGAPGATGTTNSITISSTDDIWSKLTTELSQRLIILVPKQSLPNSQGASGSAIVPALSDMNQIPQAPSNNGLQIMGMNPMAMQMYNTQTVGHFSINAETGAITVQAPKYILDPLDKYLKQVQEMYNTTIIFEGELVSITTSNSKSEGIDWNSFGSAGNVGTIAQNSILGGAVITPPAGGAIASAIAVGNVTTPGAGALFGVTGSGFSVLNAFLSSVGEVKVKDKPIIHTTSGTPVKFQSQVIHHYQEYQQTAAAGGVGSASVATNTIDVPYQIGMVLRLNPRYDVNTGLLRTQFSLDRTMLNGWENKVNPISNGSTIQILNTQLPILAETSNDGELLLKNDTVVIVSAFTEDSEDNTDSGITGFLDTPLRWLTGNTLRSKTTSTYYFVMHVTIIKNN